MASLLQQKRRGKGVRNKKKKISMAPGRMAKDLASLDGTDKEKFILEFPDPNDLLNFSCTFHVDSENSMWQDGVYKFNFKIPDEYPIKPPKVTLDRDYRIWHPNIDKDGNVCLNLLKKDWKCVCAINQVFFGLYFLFYEPNSEDPLNLEAAEEMRTNKPGFANTVRKTLRGETVYGVRYPNMEERYSQFMAQKQSLKSTLNGMTNSMEEN